jgi:K+-transporting ATPase ATPase B chain
VPWPFTAVIAIWLWLTVLFANLAESVAEGRGKAQADRLRDTHQHHRPPNRWVRLRHGCRRRTGDDDDVSSADRASATSWCLRRRTDPRRRRHRVGIASVDESAITGESAPVVRESGGDRSAVTGGTRVLSDRIVVRITSKPGETFVDRMIALVEGAADRKRRTRSR